MTDDKPPADAFVSLGTLSDVQFEEIRAEIEAPENLAVKPLLAGSFSFEGEISPDLQCLIADNPPILHAHFKSLQPKSRRQRLWEWLTRPLRVKRLVFTGGKLKRVTETAGGFSAEIGDLIWEDRWVWRRSPVAVVKELWSDAKRLGESMWRINLWNSPQEAEKAAAWLWVKYAHKQWVIHRVLLPLGYLWSIRCTWVALVEKKQP